MTTNLSSVYRGGTGTDTLHGNVDALIDSDPGHNAWSNAAFSVNVDDVAADGGLFGFSDRQEGWVEGYQWRQGGSFSGIERITVEADTVLEYHGGRAAMTAIGGNRPDFFHGGAGNETLMGDGGADLFDFSGIYNQGLDRIVGFNAAEGIWSPRDGARKGGTRTL
ncbi:hypothetical protein JL101_032720 (plasmid) [Skermanella rosea]|uniref:hypothetical protein n=1 Tax=Skermanella rosea TaxID=1817965 RepID=UPI001E556A2B|nr:hypothetical protein [Skermanella rosea]UEM07259.1 hypothetical protein JL101_032720 [Skermanella rosea]